MWSFKIGHSTLQVMLMMLMVLMVCSAPAHRVLQPNGCKMKLQKINATVGILLQEEWNNIKVIKPLRNMHYCPENFFCLAEKVVENARKENVETNKLSTLNTDLKHYNTLCPTNCTLDKSHRYHLKMFLDEVKKCVEHFLFNKPQKKEMNNKDY